MISAQPFDQSTVRSALALAGAAPSIRNSQPWRWSVEQGTVHLYSVSSPLAAETQTRDLLMSCGAALHHLRVALAASGLASTVHRLPDVAEPDHLAALEMRPCSAAATDLAHTAAILRRRSDRRRFTNRDVPHVLVTDLIARAAAHGASLRPVTAAGTRARLVDAIRATPGNRVHQPAAGEPDGTLLMLLATGSDDLIARLRAGEALSAVLLRATALGLATCALSRPLDVGSSRQDFEEEVFGGAEAPQLALRVGWAPTGRPVPPTPRRSIDDMVTWPAGRRF